MAVTVFECTLPFDGNDRAGPSRPMDLVPSGRLDAALLAQWHSQFAPQLASYFRRQGLEPGDCDDLMQEVFVRLARRADLGNVQHAEHYIMRSAAHVLIDWRRSARARAAGLHASIDSAPEISDEAPSQERVTLARDALVQLRTAIRRMPERTATIFELHHFHDRPYVEIARQCGIAVRTVEDHMARANLFLLAALEESE